MQNLAVHWHEGLFLRPHHLQAWDRHWHEQATASERWSNPHAYGVASCTIVRDALAAGFFQLEAIRCKMPEGTLVEIRPGEASQRRDHRDAFLEVERRPESLAAKQSASNPTAMNPHAAGEATGTRRAPAAESSDPARTDAHNAARSVPATPNTSSCVDVYLGIPRFQLGVSNVATPRVWTGPDGGNDPDGHPSVDAQGSQPVDEFSGEHAGNGPARYRPLQVHLPDEVDAASVEPILVRHVNARILLSTDDLDGYEVLRIARVVRGSDGGEMARLDTRYIPPCLTAGAWPGLRGDVLYALHDRITQRIEWLSQTIQQVGIDANQVGGNQVRQLMLLQTLQQGAATLDGLKRSTSISPESIYLELVRICGSLDLFATGQRRPADLPAYDHDNLGGVLFAIKARIESCLAQIGKRPFRQRNFVGGDRGMHVELDAQWLTPGWRVYLGVRRASLPADALISLLQSGKLDWKLGSLRQIDTLFRGRVAGVDLKSLEAVPGVLPPTTQWSYFEFHRHGVAWDDVVTTRHLALRIQDDRVANLAELPGQSTLVLRDGNHARPLQFAVFAMKETSS
ncbi:MAG: type VI secretion system baseplate subunit TssK [Planctomycetota bacterium]